MADDELIRVLEPELHGRPAGEILRLCAPLRAWIREREREAVTHLRLRDKLTWAEIAEHLPTSTSAAWQRFHDVEGT